MDREEMIKRLEDGEKPIDVAIQKWVDISNTETTNVHKARHQLDEGKSNCALCYTYQDCELCPLYLQYGVGCDESKYVKDKKYGKDFYSQFRETGDVEIMLNALNEVKKNINKLIGKSKQIKKQGKTKKNKKSTVENKFESGNDTINKKKFDAYQNPGVDEANFK